MLFALACLVAREARQRRRAAGAEADRRQPRPRTAVLVVPLALLVGLRPAAAVDDGVHRAARVPVREGDAARGAQHRAQVFRHLHALSLRFHLQRQTGGLTRDVERGTRGISTLISFTLFSILPTLVEITLVSAILIARYDWTFMAITAGALRSTSSSPSRSPNGARISAGR